MQFKWKLIALTGMMMQLLTYANAQQPAVSPLETVRFTVKEAVDYALVNQYAVRNAKLDELITLAKNKEVSGLALPQVSGTATFQDNPIIQKQLIDASNFDPSVPKGTLVAFSFGLKYNALGNVDVNQVLFDPSVLVALQARKTLEELARKGVQKSEVDVKTAVYKAYFNVLAADKANKILQESLLRMEKTLNETRETYKNGLVEKLDVDRLVVQYNNLKSEELRLRNTRDVGIASLKFQMGMPMAQQLELKDTLSNEALTADIQEQGQFNYNNRIEYQLLETQKRANEYNLKRYRMQGLPSLNAFGQGGVSRQSNTFNYFQQQLWYGYVSWGLTLKVPIFSGLQRRRKVDQAFIEVQKSTLSMENTRNSIDLDQTQSSTNLRNNITLLQSQEDNMKLANEVYNTTNIKYKEGVGSSLEVITAETALLTAQNNYFSALFNVIVSRIDYLKAYGKL
ncbi:TolC family protein [Chitinophaga sp. SYP-B3965]|uniref:TolC family protein n=1 Tax=Chitinophaga sp. SYP-B3965 TaxID=2663120 RepID=UPI0012998E7A|nr:TolC family protein [Chitinophaga sp. SYP-B3965]MRG48668.1 TolC family protein [Chitinophaga sp. SYP-B3965]